MQGLPHQCRLIQKFFHADILSRILFGDSSRVFLYFESSLCICREIPLEISSGLAQQFHFSRSIWKKNFSGYYFRKLIMFLLRVSITDSAGIHPEMSLEAPPYYFFRNFSLMSLFFHSFSQDFFYIFL